MNYRLFYLSHMCTNYKGQASRFNEHLHFVILLQPGGQIQSPKLNQNTGFYTLLLKEKECSVHMQLYSELCVQMMCDNAIIYTRPD